MDMGGRYKDTGTWRARNGEGDGDDEQNLDGGRGVERELPVEKGRGEGILGPQSDD
jgi:hypothetical protein